MVAEMQQFVRALPAHLPPPSAAGITEEEKAGYLFWQDSHDFCLEINFHEGQPPLVFIGFSGEEPEYAGYYCETSQDELNKLILFMQEPETCH